MNQVLNEVFAATAQSAPTYNSSILAETLAVDQPKQFPYAEAVLAGIRRADLLENLASDQLSEAQSGQFLRWLRGRGTFAVHS